VAGCVRDWRVDDSGVVFWLDGAGAFIGVEGGLAQKKKKKKMSMGGVGRRVEALVGESKLPQHTVKGHI